MGLPLHCTTRLDRYVMRAVREPPLRQTINPTVREPPLRQTIDPTVHESHIQQTIHRVVYELPLRVLRICLMGAPNFLQFNGYIIKFFHVREI